MTLKPKRFPVGNGRDPSVSHMEMGLAGAWMNNKLFQLWRLMVLNLRILKTVTYSKRA